MKRMLETLTLDRAEALIRQAVTGDRELFQALLTPASQLSRQQESRLANVLTSTAVGTAGGAAGASVAEPSLEDLIMRDSMNARIESDKR